MNRIGRSIESVIFLSRWLLLPFLLGLIIGVAALLYMFILKLIAFMALVGTAPEEEAIVAILKLVDLALTANLLVIVICASFENFVARIGSERRADWPKGLTGIGFAVLKQKLLGSIVAIAAVSVLEWFMDIDRSADTTKLAWVVGILLAFVMAMLLLAVADWINSATETKKSE